MPGLRRLPVVVALAIVAVLSWIGLRQIFEHQREPPRVTTALAEVQENVRQAAYHLLHQARMIGGGGLPLVSGTTWVAARIGNNVGEVYDDQLAGPIEVLPGTDVLTLRGFFELAPYFTDPDPSSAAGSDLTISADTGQVRLRSRVGDERSPGLPSTGSGIVLIGRNRYAVAEVSSVPNTPQWLTVPARPGQTLAETSFRVITLGFAGGTLPWSRFNPGGTYSPPTFPVYQVGILDSYTYFVDPRLRLMRVRGRTGGSPIIEPVAMSIGGLQAAFAVDLDRDGLIAPAEWLSDPDPELIAGAPVLMLRITVLGRTPFAVDSWTEPAATFAVEDMAAPDAVHGFDPYHARWCRLQVTARLRSLGP